MDLSIFTVVHSINVCIQGDFNAVIDDSEVCGRAADTSASMANFHNCIRDTSLVQLPFTGCPYTWHNCSEGTRSLWKRLDRMIANVAWLDVWPSSSYISALPSTSDHSPLILTGMDSIAERAIFRFDNYFAQQPGFLDSVESTWKHRITRTAMYDVVCKLKNLKAVFRRQKKLTGDLTNNVKRAKIFLDKAQALFDKHKEDIYLNLVKCCSQNLLGGSSTHRILNLGFLRHELKHTITTTEASTLVAPVTHLETKKAFFDIEVDSALGPDGYTSAFFRTAWPVIGQSMVEAVGQFFKRRVLPLMIDYSQNAFVLGTSISDNILLAQELLAEYNQARLPARCLKVNPAKNQIILSRAVQQERQHILEYVGFQEGSLPVKYLGIPLTSSRLTLVDCRPLIDKTANNRGWSTTLLKAPRIAFLPDVVYK
ncbi:hypothetical protein Sango_3108300 [Sesamum angolense]|uniref:Uncharacterized protein n=1 Tax=Sesamum angolense TaxID=2727404 RepID=A0AAE1W0B1_9LAMI|nr:hypothetical protein Sango_3108300 [Sesamum angolense]